MKLYLLILSTFIFLLSACNQKEASYVAHSADYEQYLSPDQQPNTQAAKKELDYWTEKFKDAPTQYPYQAKMAGAHTALFSQTGNIEHLNEAYQLYKEINKKTNNTQASYLRSLARNCISQHKFREAYQALGKAEELGEQLRHTHKMLFDVCLELGNKKEAKKYLVEISDIKDFDYNIRMSKWSDHEGNLDGAIEYMEKALTQAQEKDNHSLICWSVTNLGDYYGHAGRVQESYQQYLKALELEPDNMYALKGIAWIAFSKDRNIQEAKRILKSLKQRSDVPDYNLLLAEISEYENNDVVQTAYTNAFLEQLRDPRYGDMYNTYLADISSNPERILSLAKQEIQNRPTPMSYSLLAWAYYKNDDKEKALEIIEEQVRDKTFEPSAQYKMAVIYKANNWNDRAQALKAELGGSFYELGPVMEEKIGSL